MGVNGAAVAVVSSPRTPIGSGDEARLLAGDLGRRGVQLRIEGGVLRWRAAPGSMTVPLLRQVKRHEAALIAMLCEGGER